jgi:hypothetical protein
VRPRSTAPRDVTHVCWLDGSRSETVIPTRIETEVWVSRPDSPYLRRERSRTIEEVHALLSATMTEPHPRYPEQVWIEGADDGFSVWPFIDARQEWPAGSTIVYSVEGASEGDYVHVDVIDRDGVLHPLLISKTFDGRDAAWAFARRLADLLGV